MKKEALKTAKKAKKAIRKELFEKLSVEIKGIIEKNGYDSKKASKEIKKVANHLAKKLSQKNSAEKTEKPVKPEAEAPAKPAPAVKTAAAREKAKPEAATTEK